jgi:CRP-like cAMP-binding protein
MSPDRAAEPQAGEISPELLRTLFLFEQLPDTKLAWLAAEGEGRLVPAGEWIYREGDPADEFMVLLSGTASLQRAMSGDDV